jgi:hypothetical protein
MPLTPPTTLLLTNNLQARNPEDLRTKAVRLPGGVSLPAGQVLGEFTTVLRNEVQTLTINNTGGTYRLGVNGRFTTALAHNANAATIQAAMNALIGAGNVTVGGTGPFTFTFIGDYSNRNVALLVLDAASLTGGTASTLVKTTPGSAGQTGTMTAATGGASDGTQIAAAVLLSDVRTNARGMVIDQWGRETSHTVEVAYAGEFYTADLVGLTATFAGHLGRLVDGSAITDVGAVLSLDPGRRLT